MAGARSRIYLLDTSVILHLVRGNSLGEHLANTFALRDLVYRPFVSVVSHGELRVMADRNSWGAKKLDALEHALNNLVTLDLNDRAIIDGYVEVSRVSRSVSGGARNLSDNDLWIAACAKAAGAVLLTTDKDFLHLNPHCCAVHWEDPTPWG